MGFFKKKSIEELKAEREAQGKKHLAESERAKVKQDIANIKSARRSSGAVGNVARGGKRIFGGLQQVARGTQVIVNKASKPKTRVVYKATPKPKKKPRRKPARQQQFSFPGF